MQNLVPMQHLVIVTTGGTIDKIYFDDLSNFQIGEPQIGKILEAIGAGFSFEVIALMRKDSLHITDADRDLIRATIAAQSASHILVTHGTDTMVATALRLMDIPGTFVGIAFGQPCPGAKVSRWLIPPDMKRWITDFPRAVTPAIAGRLAPIRPPVAVAMKRLRDGSWRKLMAVILAVRVQEIEQAYGEFFRNAGDGGDLRWFRFPDPRRRSEFLQQQGFPVRRHAGAVVEGAFLHAAAVEELVVAVREAVRLVADALEKLEGTPVVRDEEGIGFAGEEHLLALFRQPDDGQFLQAQCPELFERAGKLALATIDDHQIRKHDLRLALLGKAALGFDQRLL